MARKSWSFSCLIAFVLMLTPAISAQEKADKFEVGGHFGLLFDKDKVTDTKVVLPEFGGNFTFFFSKHLGLEVESSFYPRRDFKRPIPGDFPLMKDGITKANYNGPAQVNLFGIRAGIRTGKVGIFAKARPGFAVFHPVYDCPSSATTVNQCNEIRKKEFTMDFGAVIEGYLSRHSFVRFDAGDTYLLFGKSNMLFSGSGVPWINYPYGADHRHQLHLKMGIGVRF